MVPDKIGGSIRLHLNATRNVRRIEQNLGKCTLPARLSCQAHVHESDKQYSCACQKCLQYNFPKRVNIHVAPPSLKGPENHHRTAE